MINSPSPPFHLLYYKLFCLSSPCSTVLGQFALTCNAPSSPPLPHLAVSHCGVMYLVVISSPSAMSTVASSWRTGTESTVNFMVLCATGEIQSETNSLIVCRING